MSRANVQRRSDEVTRLSIWELMERAATRTPAARFIFSTDGKQVTRSTTEIRIDALRAARTMAELGLKKGDAVVSQLPHSSEGAALFFGAMALGLIFIPVVHIYDHSELEYIMKTSRARLLIMPSAWHNVDFATRLLNLKRRTVVEFAVMLGGAAVPEAVKSAGVFVWEKLLESAFDPTLLPQVEAQAPCMYLYTSGTTSAPKAAVHSHSSLIAEGSSTEVLLKHVKNRTAFTGSMAGHIGPITALIRQLALGVDTVYLDRWEPAVAAALIAEHQVGWGHGVPYAFQTLLPLAMEGRVPSLKMFMVGGSSVTPKLIEDAERAGIKACRTYGSTEHPTIAQGLVIDPLERRANSDGRVMPDCLVRLLDDNDLEVAPGEVGEIVSRGPDCFMGYLDPAHNADAFTADGKWFRTGDLGVFDQQDFLSIVDRKKDIIIRGGENISSKEVEDILCRHASILEAATVAVPDPLMGERVGAFVVLKPGSALDLTEVERHFVSQGVAKQKIPEKLFIVEGFPRNTAGKVIKTQLRSLIKGD